MLACSLEFKQVAVSSVACSCTHMSSGYFFVSFSFQIFAFLLLVHTHVLWLFFCIISNLFFSPDEGWSSQPKH